ncbi:MAG TPA: hypothetical protein VK927_01145 [Adhaeribacter sp.]|nr:hypothetical protein [Adhaeribacter sp.]
MEKPGSWDWDEGRYLELNTYFRIRIKVILESDPYVKQVLTQGQGLQLDQLTDRMSARDQELWLEFMCLDQLKFEQDLQNHLEGRGKPLNPKTGFNNPLAPDHPDDNPTW